MRDGARVRTLVPGGRLNAVETCLDKWAERTPERTMYQWEDSDGNNEAISYSEMARRTDHLANALQDLCVGESDVVRDHFPLHPNGFAASMICLRIGAAFSQVFPGYGAGAMGHRIDDSGAEVVIAPDGYRRGGSVTDLAAKIDSDLNAAPAVEDVVLYDHLD